MIHFKSIRARIFALVGSLVILIILSSSLINYFTVRNTLIKDVREHQLLAFTEAAQSDIQMVLDKAIETSLLLASDPLLIKWFSDGETDKVLGQLVKDKLTSISESRGYFTVFAVNNVTKNYWANGNVLIDVISENDADDSWYFDIMKDAEKIVLNFDYNPEMDQTLFFFNALIGSKNNPLGNAGVGINPDIMIKEFRSKKLTENSQLWVLDKAGNIQISANAEEIGKNISEFLPAELPIQILDASGKKIISDIEWNNKRYEFA